MQRTGRKGHAMFRVVVQDSHVTPTSGKVVAFLGSYDPHAKAVILDKDKAALFLQNGAQPSERAAALLKREGVKLPKWVVANDSKAGKLRHPEKLRKNKPEEAKEAPTAEESVVETTETPTEPAAEAPAEEPTKTPAAEAEPEPKEPKVE
ncbi:MAG TPA: 30S ribosomal protein S16 [Patescibacteria group bacterium]|nr:30S ribosomal protein S16 [Patescibacteria group bacterium]